MTKYEKWVKINWHKVLSYDWKDKISIICWTCWAYAFKTRKRIYDSIWCEYCKIRKDWFNKYKKQYYSWVLQIPENTINSRLRRWYSFKQAIWYEPLKIPTENFSKQDLIWLWNYNQNKFNENKRYEEKSFSKFNLKKNNY